MKFYYHPMKYELERWIDGSKYFIPVSQARTCILLLLEKVEIVDPVILERYIGSNIRWANHYYYYTEAIIEAMYQLRDEGLVTIEYVPVSRWHGNVTLITCKLTAL